MPRSKQVFRTSSPMHRTATWADAVLMVGLGVLLYAGVRLALGAPAAIRGPEISLAPSAASLALANVLQNAVKFSPPGGKVRVLARAEGAEAILAVSDSGPGVTPDERDRLFERFYRGSASRSAETPGSELGLAISRSLVEAQGGRITVETTEGGWGDVSHPSSAGLLRIAGERFSVLCDFRWPSVPVGHHQWGVASTPHAAGGSVPPVRRSWTDDRVRSRRPAEAAFQLPIRSSGRMVLDNRACNPAGERWRELHGRSESQPARSPMAPPLVAT